MEGLDMGLAVARLVRFDTEGTLKAYCDVTVGERFLIKGLRVVAGKNGLFVSMPRQQGKDHRWYDSVVPLSRETKTEVERLVLEAYQKEESPR
jgi:stage V sporulation protein G